MRMPLRDRDIYVMERDDVLWLPIFVNRECALIEIGNDVLMVVNDGGMQHDLVHVFFEDEDALVVELVFLITLLVRGRRFVGGKLGARASAGPKTALAKRRPPRPEETKKKPENPGGPIGRT